MNGIESLPSRLEGVLRLGTSTLAALAEVIGALIIGIAVVRALASFLAELATTRHGGIPNEAIRLTLGRSLTLALEFLLAADILRTAVAPSWQEIGQLGAIVVIRTALNFFLQRELDAAARRDEGPAAESPPPGPKRVMPPIE